MAKRVLVVGGMSLDLIYQVPEAARLGELTYASRVVQCGGGAARSGLVLARHAKTHIISPLGADAAGRMVADEMEAANVTLHIIPEPSTVVSSIFATTTDRAIVTVPPPPFPEHLDISDLPNPDLILATHHSAEAAVRLLMEGFPGANLAIDLGAGPDVLWSDALVARANVVTGSISAICRLGQDGVDIDNAARGALSARDDVVLVTSGEGPVVLVTKKGVTTFEPPTIDVADTCGCGDVLLAEFAGQRLLGVPNELAASRAVAFASLHATVLGNDVLAKRRSYPPPPVSLEPQRTLRIRDRSGAWVPLRSSDRTHSGTGAWRTRRSTSAEQRQPAVSLARTPPTGRLRSARPVTYQSTQVYLARSPLRQSREHRAPVLMSRSGSVRQASMLTTSTPAPTRMGKMTR